jgi:hypothetical protein
VHLKVVRLHRKQGQKGTSAAKPDRAKTYIPIPKEHEHVAKTTDEQKTEKEVITTSHKEKKAVAPATKTAPVAAKTDAKKSGKK